MRRSTARSAFTLVFVGMNTLCALPSCGGSSKAEGTQAPNAVDEPLFLLGALDIDATQCVARADASAARLPNGILDLTFSSTYTTALLVENPYVRGTAGQTATETERVTLRTAEITLTTSDGTVLGSYSSVGTGAVDAAPIGSAGYGILAVPLIPAELGASDGVQNAHALIAKVHVTGEALNGLPLSSNDIDLPITVCKGCLVRYPADAADVTVPAGQSYLCTTSTIGVQVTAAPCIMGQDTPFSCVYCSAEFDVCRDPSHNPSL